MKTPKNYRPKNLNDLSVASKKVMKGGLYKPTQALCAEHIKGGYPTLTIYIVVKKKTKKKNKEQNRAIEKIVWIFFEAVVVFLINYFLQKPLS